LGGEGHSAHAHCDLLSLILYVHGHPVLVDSGTFTYRGRWRDRLRRTAAHNTVLIDGQDQATPLQNFSWKHAVDAKCTEWSGNRFTGVLSFADRMLFSRTLAHPRRGVWELIDSFSGSDEHRFEWFFHFAPGLEVVLEEEGRLLTIIKNSRKFLLLHLPNSIAEAELRPSWYSPQYGFRQANVELYAQWRGALSGSAGPFHWQFQLAD
jgi:hypothetical protein